MTATVDCSDVDYVNINARDVSCEERFPSEMAKSKNLAFFGAGSYRSPLYSNLNLENPVL